MKGVNEIVEFVKIRWNCQNDMEMFLVQFNLKITLELVQLTLKCGQGDSKMCHGDSEVWQGDIEVCQCDSKICQDNVKVTGYMKSKFNLTSK